MRRNPPGPGPVAADRSRFGRQGRAGAASRPGRADLIACHEVLRGLAVAFGAGGQPDRAGPLLHAAEVLRELLGRPEAPVRPARSGLVGPGAGRRTLGSGRPAPDEVPPVSRRPLSPRERDVLALLVEGCSNADIAAALWIGQRTAESHVASILGKLGVSSRAAAIAYAVRHGLLA